MHLHPLVALRVLLLPLTFAARHACYLNKQKKSTMKKGFLHAVKAAEGPRTRMLNGPAESNGTSGNDMDIALLQSRLAEAEEELQKRRKERLRVETEADAEAGGATNATQQRAAGEQIATALPAALPGQETLEALASHAEPPPAVLHRLAECFMLVIEAKPLISLGDHPLPGHVPWQNLQLLLRKSVTSHTYAGIADALASKPYGARLRQAVRERFSGGDQPLTREAVEAADGRCTGIFDCVEAFVQDSPGAGGLAVTCLRAAGSVEPTTGQSAREQAAAAVAEQESEVSNLRRQMRAAKQVANKKHEAKKAVQKEAQVLQEQEREAKREVAAKAAAEAEAAAAALKAAEQGPETDLGQGSSMTSMVSAVVSSSAPAVAASCSQAVMYRLSETEVPPLQETVLISMLGALSEPRLGSHRTIEITGFSEVREEPEIAGQRAEHVRAWLVDKGADEDRLQVAAPRPEEPRGSRRTELRLIDRSPSSHQASAAAAARVTPDFATIRNHSKKLIEEQSSVPLNHSGPDADISAEESVAKAGLQPQPSDVDAATQPGESAASSAAGTSGSGDAANAPCILIEEVRNLEDAASPTAPSTRRRLRVTFAAPDLDARDAALEVGSLAVRLASHAGAWPSVEAALPFAVDPDTAGAPRFSRRKGTLTLELEEFLN